ncbi:hypothetical protein J6590_088605 [Homalodisca vitripennis]|nr:hypothetical protein J6590_088605 [Homalodisca vitripennis]
MGRDCNTNLGFVPSNADNVPLRGIKRMFSRLSPKPALASNTFIGRQTVGGADFNGPNAQANLYKTVLYLDDPPVLRQNPAVCQYYLSIQTERLNPNNVSEQRTTQHMQHAPETARDWGDTDRKPKKERQKR